jgi:hypothetical protein
VAVNQKARYKDMKIKKVVFWDDLIDESMISDEAQQIIIGKTYPDIFVPILTIINLLSIHNCGIDIEKIEKQKLDGDVELFMDMG